MRDQLVELQVVQVEAVVASIVDLLHQQDFLALLGVGYTKPLSHLAA